MATPNDEDPKHKPNRLAASVLWETATGALAAGVCAGLAWYDSAQPFVLPWFALMLVVYAIRAWSGLRAARRISSAGDVVVRYRPGGRGLLLTGLIWGAAAGALLAQTGIGVSGICVLAACFLLALSLLGLYLGARDVVIPFTLAAALPAAAGSLMLRDAAGGLTAILCIGGAAAIVAVSWQIDGFARRSVKVRFERDNLRSRVGLSAREIKRLQLGVKTRRENEVALEAALDRTHSELSSARSRVEALSATLQRVTPFDDQTGLLNATNYQRVLRREWARMARQEMPVTVVHMALDHFDGFAETYGALAYEAMLRRVSEIIRRAGKRPGDVAARLDEDRFTLLFPEADEKSGERLAERVRAKLECLHIPNANSPQRSIVTASFGVATLIATSHRTTDELSRRADTALHEARFGGGDRVVQYRTLGATRLEHWDPAAEGHLTLEGLMRKLALMGYAAQPKRYEPGARLAEKLLLCEAVDAVVQGQLSVSLDGESTILNPGDCLFIPGGVETGMAVLGGKPVVCLEAVKA